MVGAAGSAGRAALKLGAGRVYLGIVDEHAPAVDPIQPELMLRPAEAALALAHTARRRPGTRAVGRGPGAAAPGAREPGPWSSTRMHSISSPPTCARPRAREANGAEPAHTASRRSGTSAAFDTAKCSGIAWPRLDSPRYRAGVVLKGAGSICAWPDGRGRSTRQATPGWRAPAWATC